MQKKKTQSNKHKTYTFTQPSKQAETLTQRANHISMQKTNPKNFNTTHTRHTHVQRQTSRTTQQTKYRCKHKNKPASNTTTTIHNIHTHVYKLTSITHNTTHIIHKHGQKQQTKYQMIAQPTKDISMYLHTDKHKL